MTPQDKTRARELLDKASPGEWKYENLNWVGSPLFAVYTVEQSPYKRGPAIFDNIQPDGNSYNNIEFVINAHNLLPKALDYVEALEEAVRSGKPQLAPAALSAKEIEEMKEWTQESTQGKWSWEDDSHLGQGVYTVYAGREPMMHGYNLFGRMDTGDNAENNLNFITEIHTLFPKILDHIEKLEQQLAPQSKADVSRTPPPQQGRKNTPGL